MPRAVSLQSLLLGALLLASLILFFWGLSARPFWDYDEALYANIIRETGASGNLLTLNYNGYPWYDKPPLYYWSSIGFDAVIDDPNLSYRLTAAVLGFASVFLVALIAYEWGAGALGALAAGAILLSIGPFVDASREVRLDVPVVSMILLATYCFIRGRRSPLWYLGVGTAIGLGIMFKSVVGFLPGVFILAYALVYRDWNWLKKWELWLGVALGFLVVAPWHIYQTVVHGGAFWHAYLWYHVYERFVTNILPTSTWTTFGYLGYLARYAAPWSWLFIVSVGLSFYALARREVDARPMLVASITTVAIFSLFSAASSKLPYYLMPVYPFLALSLVLTARYIWERFSTIQKYRTIVWGIVAVLFIGAFANMIMFWLHLTPIERVSDTVALDEQRTGLILASQPDIPAYTYEYNLWDVIQFYGGDRHLTKINLNDPLTKPIFLIMWSKIAVHTFFPPALAQHFKLLYQGPAVTLYYFSP